MASQTAQIESKKDFPRTKQGKADYWSTELKGSQTTLKSWHRQAEKIHRRYLDEKPDSQRERDNQNGFRLNIFYSNMQTVMGLMYGRLPKIEVSRRYDDAQDDVGRVASIIMQRLLDNDMARYPTQYDSVLRAVLEDRLVPGLGVAKIRYEVDTDTQVTAEVVDTQGVVITAEQAEKVVTAERAPADYFHWRDVLWSWARTPSDLRWMAFRTFITKDEAETRYGKDKADLLTYKKQQVAESAPGAASLSANPDEDNTWLKAETWEIWCKESRTVYEFAFDVEVLLKTTPDPLQLQQFFPAPPFLIANATTSLYKPTPDYHFTQRLYTEIDALQTRIAVITEAVRVVGVYDASSTAIKDMFQGSGENQMIPVDSWAMFAEKGGLNGQIDWFPIADVVNALLQLRQLRDETIQLLYQVSGMADVMRGQLDNQYEGVGQTDEKVKFGSARLQKTQEEFATFVTNLMSIKAEVVSRHFDPQQIASLSNAETMTEDPQLIAQAIELLQDWDQARLKIKIESSSMALVDYAQLQQERGAFLSALSSFMQASAPLIEQEPSAAPYMLQLLQWGLAGFRGADEAEGILDKAIAASQDAQKKAQENPQPDPEQMKMQAQQQLEQLKQQGQQQLEQIKLQSTMQIRQQDMEADVQTKQQEHQMKMREIEAQFLAEAQAIQLKAQADIEVETRTSQVNAEQQALGVEAELNKDTVVHQMDMEAAIAQAALKMRETTHATAAKIATMPDTDTDEDED